MDSTITTRVMVLAVNVRLSTEEAASLHEWLGEQDGAPHVVFKAWKALDDALALAREAMRE